MAHKTFDRNLIVIGAGSAGLVSAYIAATTAAKVTLIERHKMGGDCLNTGCVPSKALIRSAQLAALIKRADAFGINVTDFAVDFSAVMQRVQSVIKQIEPHDSISRYQGLGVECMTGKATLTSPWQVKVDGQTLNTKNIIIATGAKPRIPDIPGLDTIDYLSSDNLWELRELPERLVILGGGPIGCELAQAFARLGSQVTQIESSTSIMAREDADISALVTHCLKQDGVDIRTQHNAKAVIKKDSQQLLQCDYQGQSVAIPFDKLLVAVGRVANTRGFGLEDIGVALNANSSIKVNDHLQTSVANIFACGDVIGHYQFTHTAAHQAWYATANALFGRFKRFKVDYSVIPWATFTDPEVARVGLNEQAAQAAGIPYEVTQYGIDDLDRAITEGDAYGTVKVLTVPKKDKILGVTIVAAHAGELITEYISAMKHGLGMNAILRTIHIYPTLAEANKFAAGQWKKAQISQWVFTVLKKYHHWMLR